MAELGKGNLESQRRPSPRPRGVRAVSDAVQAILAASRAAAAAYHGPEVSPALGAPPAAAGFLSQSGTLQDAAAAIEFARAHAGKRPTAVIHAASLVDQLHALSRLVGERCGAVFHAFIGHGAGDAVDLASLCGLGVGILLARDAQDASDLALIALRAAEDAEAPILVVHEGDPRALPIERVFLADAPLVRALLEEAPPKVATMEHDGTPARRAAARIPFAIASAMRAFERHAGRPIDLIDAHRVADAELVFVAGGSLAGAARAAVDHLRRTRPSPRCGVVQLTSLRPFPGPALVKALSRARSVVVLEHGEALLAQSAPLAVEVKSAFADALTWAPGYSGIGRIPDVHAASVEGPAGFVSPADLLGAVEHALLGDQARRSLLLPVVDEPVAAPDAFTVRVCEEPTLLLSLLAELYEREARAIARKLPTGEVMWDVTVSPEAQGGAARGAVDIVLCPHDGALAEQALVGIDDRAIVVAPDGNSVPRRARMRPSSPSHAKPLTRAAELLAAVLAVLPGDLDLAVARGDGERLLRRHAGSDEGEAEAAVDAWSKTLNALRR